LIDLASFRSNNRSDAPAKILQPFLVAATGCQAALAGSAYGLWLSTVPLTERARLATGRSGSLPAMTRLARPPIAGYHPVDFDN